MEKKKSKITMITKELHDEYTTITNYDELNQTLTYQEKKEIVTNVKIDLKKHKLTRDNKDLNMEYLFKLNDMTTNQVYLKELDKYIDIKIKTEKYNYDNNKLEIEYILIDSNEHVYFKIEY